MPRTTNTSSVSVSTSTSTAPPSSVFEVDMRPEPLGPGNPYGNAWRAVPTLLRRESEAQRLIDASAARTWKVVNPDVLNEFGDSVGYRLVPGPTATMLADPSSSVARRAVFASKHLMG